MEHLQEPGSIQQDGEYEQRLKRNKKKLAEREFFYYLNLYCFAKTFSGVFMLHTPIIKSMIVQIAVTNMPTIVHDNTNITTPDAGLPA